MEKPTLPLLSGQTTMLIHRLSGDEQVRGLLTLSVGRVMENNDRRGVETTLVQEQLRHIVDWLTAARLNGEAWLSNVDTENRPRKLMKFGSLEQIVVEADKAMLKAAARLAGTRLQEGDEALEMELPDGFYVVRLLTATALDRESGQMQHCIGEGSYDRALASGDQAFYSLRDAYGKAHATAEVETASGRLVQLQGKQNATPIKKYLDVIITFFRDRGVKAAQLDTASDVVYDVDWNEHDINALPEELSLGADFTVEGRQAIRLPNTLHIAGSLIVKASTVSRMPETLHVEQDFILESALLATQTANMTIEGSVRMKKATVAATLAERLSVGYDMAVSESVISGLPPVLRVGNHLGVVNSPSCVDLGGIRKIRKLTLSGFVPDTLPEGLELLELVLRDSRVKKLPSDLRVTYGLTVDSGLTELPDGLRLVENLNIGRSPIKSLPKRLTVGGTLDISGTPITELPSDLSVGRDLLCWKSMLTSLGSIRLVKGNLNIRGTPMKRLPDGLDVMGGFMADESALESLGEGARFHGFANIHKTALTELPETAWFGGSLNIEQTAISSIDHLDRIEGDLNIGYTAVTSIPEGLTVTGSLDISATGIRSFPAGVAVGKTIKCAHTLLESLAEDTVYGSIYHPLGDRLPRVPVRRSPRP